MIHLFFLETDCRYDPEVIGRFLPLLSERRVKQIESMRSDSDRKILLYSDILLRWLLCRHLSLQNRELVFRRNTYGKPYLKSDPSLFFSVSHTRNAIAVVLSDGEAGVDIERIGRPDRDAARTAFTDREYDFVYTCEEDAGERFFEIWTRKEAYLKWLGRGWAETLADPGIFRPDIACMISTFRKGDYRISVCSEQADGLGELTEVREDSFLDYAFRKEARIHG